MLTILLTLTTCDLNLTIHLSNHKSIYLSINQFVSENPGGRHPELTTENEKCEKTIFQESMKGSLKK